MASIPWDKISPSSRAIYNEDSNGPNTNPWGEPQLTEHDPEKEHLQPLADGDHRDKA